MYTLPAFRIENLSEVHTLMRKAPLANLVTATAEGLVATPVPLFLDSEEGPLGTLYGHIARANRQWTLATIGDSLAIFMGPDAYVRPSWYPSKAKHGRVVPTWNYVTAQAVGRVEFFDDRARLLAVVSRLTDAMEQSLPGAWSVADAPADYLDHQLAAIIGLRLPIARLDGKRKMSQNRSAADHDAVAAGLESSDRPGDRAAAALMWRNKG